jgi:heme/copper-type cytochrome/quinol oxidase subunit 2
LSLLISLSLLLYKVLEISFRAWRDEEIWAVTFTSMYFVRKFIFITILVFLVFVIVAFVRRR